MFSSAWALHGLPLPDRLSTVPVSRNFGRPFVKRFALCYRTVVCLSVLSVTLVYCGQTVGRIKMKLGMRVGLGPGHLGLGARWGPMQLPFPQRGAPGGALQFLAHICCGQMAGWIKMPLGMEVGLSPGDFVFDGDPAPFPKRPLIFGPCLLRPNGCMDQDATWYGGRFRPRRHCVGWEPS